MATRSLVVKIGTTSVTDLTGGVAFDALTSVARDVVELRRKGWTVVVVTSGAITAGWSEVGQGRPRPSDSVVAAGGVGRWSAALDARVA